MDKHTYMTLFRPPMPGAIPKENLLEVESFDERKPCGGKMAWGTATYSKPLTDKQISDYELAPLEINQ